jgi:hypothetical protein
MIPIKWVLDGKIHKDAGDVGGDIQVGPAISARFRSDERPDARFEVTVYATAKLYSELNEEAPTCLHTEPEGWVCKNGWTDLHQPNNGSRCHCYLPPEHLACSHKPGTVDLQVQYEYRTNGTTESGHYESDEEQISYAWVGSEIGYTQGGRNGIVGEVEYATADARTFISNWVNFVNYWLRWDGVSEVKG